MEETLKKVSEEFTTYCKAVTVIPLCPTPCISMDYSPQGPSLYGILQARILEWVAIPFSRGSSWLTYQTRVSYIAGRLFSFWTAGKSL